MTPDEVYFLSVCLDDFWLCILELAFSFEEISYLLILFFDEEVCLGQIFGYYFNVWRIHHEGDSCASEDAEMSN